MSMWAIAHNIALESDVPSLVTSTRFFWEMGKLYIMASFEGISRALVYRMINVDFRITSLNLG